MSRPARLARRAAILLAAFALPALPFLLLGELPGERWLSARDDDAIGFAAIGAALLAVDVALPVPSSVVGSLLGARLGLTMGFVATWLGLFAGNLLGWAVGRLALGRFDVDVPVVPTAWIVFATRSVPIAAEGLTLAAGAARMPLRLFALASAAGNACYAGVLVAVGAAAAESPWTGPLLALPLLLAGGAALLWSRFLPIARRPG
jgi:uncharacterized membrane protein YdjX (TVP38/TMEM64 family)